MVRGPRVRLRCTIHETILRNRRPPGPGRVRPVRRLHGDHPSEEYRDRFPEMSTVLENLDTALVIDQAGPKRSLRCGGYEFLGVLRRHGVVYEGSRRAARTCRGPKTSRVGWGQLGRFWPRRVAADSTSGVVPVHGFGQSSGEPFCHEAGARADSGGGDRRFSCDDQSPSQRAIARRRLLDAYAQSRGRWRSLMKRSDSPRFEAANVVGEYGETVILG